jgi:putative peptidoglycan lipid II flippase
MQAESRGLELAVGLALPATLGLMLLSHPIVRLLFEHGAFSASDTAATASALMWLALGLPAQVLVKALSPAFFAREDTMTPLMATLTGLVVAIIVALLLSGTFGVIGIAAAIALGAWSSAVVLIMRGAKSFGFSLDRDTRKRLPVIAFASLAMGVMLWLATRMTSPWAAQAHTLAQIALLAILIVCGLAIYAAILTLTGTVRWAELRTALKRSQPAD